ncbi:MAG TPA: hypothetical protein VHQ22_00825 [Terriglobales bacterium]|nr:hypothetical protein [Terriglobales bacterium]
MITRVLVYGFPAFLLFFEWLLRTALHSSFQVDSHEFMGPTLAAVGVGFLLPLTAHKDRVAVLDAQTQKALSGYQVISKREATFVGFVWIFIFVLTAGWAYDLYLSCTHTSGFKGLGQLSLGLGDYFVGIVMSEIKEVV